MINKNRVKLIHLYYYTSRYSPTRSFILFNYPHYYALLDPVFRLNYNTYKKLWTRLFIQRFI